MPCSDRCTCRTEPVRRSGGLQVIRRDRACPRHGDDALRKLPYGDEALREMPYEERLDVDERTGH